PPRRVAPPVRRLEPRHPPAFLVDQDGDVGAAGDFPHLVRQRPHLLGRVHVALEEDEPPRARVAEEGPLLRRQRQALAAEDAGRDGHRTKQLLPAALSWSQKAVASAREPKPVTAVRNSVLPPESTSCTDLPLPAAAPGAM